MGMMQVTTNPRPGKLDLSFSAVRSARITDLKHTTELNGETCTPYPFDTKSKLVISTPKTIHHTCTYCLKKTIPGKVVMFTTESTKLIRDGVELYLKRREGRS